MKTVLKFIACMIMFTCSTVRAADTGVNAVKNLTCSGKFLNPITDICWSCVLPIKIASNYKFMDMSSQEDYDSMEGKGKMMCACGSAPNTKLGIQLSFWEPTHIVETVRHPFCFVSLGGANIGGNFDSATQSNSNFNKWFGGSHGNNGTTPDASNSTTFYHAHWYKNPVITLLQVILDNDCLDKGVGMDLGWLSEIDPTWKNPDIAFLQSPDAALFANPISQALCAADCVNANLGFPSKSLFWCAGCLGSIYPYTGFIQAQASPVQAAKLMAARVQSKMHRDFAAHTATGERGLCGFRLQPLMDKRQYKIGMTYPIAARKEQVLSGMTAQQADLVKTGKCCEPLGRTPLVRDSGKSFPYKGQDFAYQVFRKRDCCSGYKFNN